MAKMTAIQKAELADIFEENILWTNSRPSRNPEGAKYEDFVTEVVMLDFASGDYFTHVVNEWVSDKGFDELVLELEDMYPTASFHSDHRPLSREV